MNVNQKIWGASSFSVSGLLATTSTDLTVGEFQFVTRTLVISAGFDGGSISLGDFTAEDDKKGEEHGSQKNICNCGGALFARRGYYAVIY